MYTIDSRSWLSHVTSIQILVCLSMSCFHDIVAADVMCRCPPAGFERRFATAHPDLYKQLKNNSNGEEYVFYLMHTEYSTNTHAICIDDYDVVLSLKSVSCVSSPSRSAVLCRG